ncbi:MAG TPA: hypothetical protein VFQ92_15395 [Blastocatellia bacterium]|nr:hypothetical protein [Blastocatellia bacterium]
MSMGLVAVQLFPGRKGGRFLRRRCEQVARRLESEAEHLLRFVREIRRRAG